MLKIETAAKFGGRIEDPKLITGRGQYSDDFRLPGQVYAQILRSPVAHADITRLDVTAALEMPGVIGIVTGADLKALGFGTMGPVAQEPQPDGTLPLIPEWPPLAYDRVRFTGEPVALVVAESALMAADALEAIEFEFEELPSSVTTEFDPEPGVPLWPHAPDNAAVRYAAGDPEAVEEAFRTAAHVVRRRIVNQRLVANPMEPRSAVARYDAEANRFEIHCPSQGASVLAVQIATIMGVPVDSVKVISRDVGGGFGTRTHVYPEYAALLEASRRFGRPVKWTATRSEQFLSDTQGRDTILDGEMALDSTHRILAIRLRSVANIGAYQSSHSGFTATANLYRCLISVYRTKAIDVGVKCIYSNTVPVGPYRGAGRPEANLIVEALVEEAAFHLGVDRASLRRKNLIRPSQMPYRAPNGHTYDSGDFPAILNRALELADYRSFESRRRASSERQRLRGLGIACYLEIAGGTPFEDVRLDVDEDGGIWIDSGLHSNGQGHATIFPELVAGRLDVPVQTVRLSDSVSTRVPEGAGSVGSRSTTVGGTAMLKASDALVRRGKEVAGLLLQASPEELVYRAANVLRPGTGQSLSFADIVRMGHELSVLERGEAPLTYPNGCHVAEVEIDPETGMAQFLSFVAVDDVGRCINHTLVEGQLHGGIAQGLGQVILEHGNYDSSGQLLSGSFMDYCMPRADDLLSYTTESLEVPATTNPLGTKGAGEAGTTGAVAAGYNAICDALRQVATSDFNMPATPADLWRLINTRAN